MKKITNILPILFLVGCSVSNSPTDIPDPEFEKISLGNRSVTELQQSDNYIYAGTDRGMVRKDKTTVTDSLWEEMTLQKEIVDFIHYNDQEMLVVAQRYDMTSDKPALYKSSDYGISWMPFQNGFGGESYTLRSIDQHPESPNILYAVSGTTIGRSMNSGNSWSMISGREWDSISHAKFIYVDPNDPSKIWTGGMNGILRPYLLRSPDGGETWENGSIFEKFPTREGMYNDLLIHPHHPDRLLAAEGASIQQTEDWGDNWELLPVQHRITTLAQGSSNSETVYASGEHATGNLFIMLSHDFGDTWTEITLQEDVTDIRVNDLLSVIVDEQEVVFIGTTKGVFRYTPGE